MVLGRSSSGNPNPRLNFDQRVKLDLAYIERQCLWLNIQILLRTISQVFVGEGAY